MRRPCTQRLPSIGEEPPEQCRRSALHSAQAGNELPRAPSPGAGGARRGRKRPFVPRRSSGNEPPSGRHSAPGGAARPRGLFVPLSVPRAPECAGGHFPARFGGFGTVTRRRCWGKLKLGPPAFGASAAVCVQAGVGLVSFCCPLAGWWHGMLSQSVTAKMKISLIGKAACLK